MSEIPFVDLGRAYDPIRKELHEAAIRVIDSGRFIGGDEVKGFEQEMATWMGVDEVCGLSCATSGLFIALRGLGVGPGDEVITTVHSAMPTPEAISLAGADVVFCDLKPDYFFLDPDEIRKKITPRTKAIIPVHLYGQPFDLDAVLAIADQHGLFVIEDCAQAQGAKYRDQYVGTYGDASVFSFFPSKNLGCFGDGGAVTARDPETLKKMRMLANHGRDKKYIHDFEGTNSRLDAIQAALLRVCLPHLDAWNAHRREAAAWYEEGLGDVEQVVLPKTLPDTEPIYHVYVALVPDREALASHLKEQGIGTGLHYPYSLNCQPAYARLGQGEGSFPRAERACAHMLSLPMHAVITREEVRTVCEALRRFYGA